MGGGGLNMVSDVCITETAQRYQSFFATCWFQDGQSLRCMFTPFFR